MRHAKQSLKDWVRSLRNGLSPKMVHAIESNQIEQLSLLARTVNGRVENQDHVMWFMSGIPTAALNGVGRAQLVPSQLDSQIRAIMKTFRVRHMPMTWWVGPSTEPDDLPKYLEAHGLRYAGEEKGIAVDLSLPDLTPYVVPGFKMDPVDNAGKVATFAHVFSIGFGLKDSRIHLALADLWQSLVRPQYPHFLHYIGYLRNEPVATVSLLLSGGVAGLYNLSAMPGYKKGRRRTSDDCGSTRRGPTPRLQICRACSQTRQPQGSMKS